MQSNPTLEGITHVIVDEVHERGVDTDILLTLFKKLIKVRRDLKLILMSATADTKLFQQYFDGVKPPIINIPGRTFPVKEHYLDQVVDLLDKSNHLKKFDFEDSKRYIENELEMSNKIESDVPISLMAALVTRIATDEREGAILCFLPGIGEISKLSELLLEDRLRVGMNGPNFVIHVMHSSVNPELLKKCFDAVPKGVRKIILVYLV